MEEAVVANPDLVGEPLFVLGRQLAEFAEDRDRLDLLAVDESGELVLIELKVTEDFRVTDLQALAYAGAYAKRTPDQLARTLRAHLAKATSPAISPHLPAGDSDDPGAGESGADATKTPVLATDDQATAHGSIETTGASSTEDSSDALVAAKNAITSFLKLDDFAEWEHSQYVRIKLIAPGFPRRVLHTVKWLGDVYDMPIEAISVRLFQTDTHEQSLVFERLLPLAGDDEFDLTVREQEDRKRDSNITRRPAALPLLIENGHIKHGQKLWLVPSALTKKHVHLYDEDNIVFQVRVHAGPPLKLAWTPSEHEEVELVAPSILTSRVWKAVVPDYAGGDWSTAVASSFVVEPGGKTLEQLAEESGVWAVSSSE